jgi:hypothetical protein
MLIEDGVKRHKKAKEAPAAHFGPILGSVNGTRVSFADRRS